MPEEQTVYLLNNTCGIPLGVYRTETNAVNAAKAYSKNSTYHEPSLYIWKIVSCQVDKVPQNRFSCLYKFDC